MSTRIYFTLFLLLAVACVVCSPVTATTTAEEKPRAVTTADPKIPVYELKLMLKPFTKTELLVEAEGWQSLVRELAVKIATAEIAVKRQTLEIDKAQEIQEQAKEAKKKLEEVSKVTKKAQRSGDMEVLQEAQQAALETQQKIEEVQKTVSEAVDAADRTAEVYEGISQKTMQNIKETAVAADMAKKAVEKVADVIDTADDKNESEVKEAAQKGHKASTEAQKAITDLSGKAKDTSASFAADKSRALMEDAAKVMHAAEEAKQSAKINLLEEVTHLRDERVRLLDNMRAVVDELNHKTDQSDTKTQAVIQDYRLYMQSVRGLNLDATDLTSARIAILGWLTSTEGGLRWIKNFSIFTGILIAAWFLARLLSFFVRVGLKSIQVPQLLSQFLIGGIRWLVFIAGFIIALSALEVSVGPVLALVGAAGFIVAFALQDSLSNFASGLMILFFRPFDVNDLVEAGGVSGRVTS